MPAYYEFRRIAVLILCGGALLQLGGCIGSLIPAALAVGEQVILSVLLSRLLPF